MKKLKIYLGIVAVGLLLSACSSGDETKEPETLKSGFNVEHVHGVGYSKEDTIYLASHDGMIQTKDLGKTWTPVGNNDFDFMGFHIQSDGTMLTSGHPGPKSNLPNPLGLMESTDNGENWEAKALQGDVDFHILTSNQKNPNLLFGVIQMESGVYESGIYKSTDRGENWDIVDATGLPDDLHGIYSLLSLPNDENILLAGTNQGVFRSEDGGKTWGVQDEGRAITALSAISGSSDLLSYSITENEVGVMISKDQGATWEKLGLDLGKDAVAYFAVHPEQPERMAAVTYENNLLFSEDGGQNWQTLMEKGKLKN